MKRRELLWLALALVSLSTVLYITHYLIFRDVHHIFIFLLSDLAFLFLEVLLVVVIIDRMLARRDKQAVIQKLNMVSGAFYGEIGTRLLKMMLGCMANSEAICPCLAVATDWTLDDFKRAEEKVGKLEFLPSCSIDELADIEAFLKEKRPFLLSLIANPNVLEHERGSDILVTVFHLTDELESCRALKETSAEDLGRLRREMGQTYRLLALEWLAYLKHLKTGHPFMYSLAVRINPFAPASL